MEMFKDDSDRLKPCPFCGSDAEIIVLEGEIENDPSVGAKCVQCTNSLCMASSALIYPLMDDVTNLLMEKWNKRPVNVMSRELDVVTLSGKEYDDLLEKIDRLSESLKGIANSDYKNWQELSTPEEFVRWAKSRAVHALTA